MIPYAWSPEDIRKVTEKAVEALYPTVAAKSPRCARLVDIVKKQMRDYGRISSFLREKAEANEVNGDPAYR